MGGNFVESGGFNLKQIFASSQSTVPLIFILSPGIDEHIDLLLFVNFGFFACKFAKTIMSKGPVCKALAAITT